MERKTRSESPLICFTARIYYYYYRSNQAVVCDWGSTYQTKGKVPTRVFYPTQLLTPQLANSKRVLLMLDACLWGPLWQTAEIQRREIVVAFKNSVKGLSNIAN